MRAVETQIPNRSSFARLGKRAARIVLAAIIVTILASAMIPFSPWASGFADDRARGGDDLALYKAEIERINGGETYYAVAADELPRRGYPTQSTFNWRTPLPMALVGALPDVRLGKALLGLIAGAAVLLILEATAREGSLRRALGASAMAIGALLFTILGELYVMPVLWAGAMIAVSLAAYGVGRRSWGVTFGLLALFFRELSGLYCVVALAIAVRERRWRETLGWAIGLSAYAAFYAWHAANVAQWRPAGGTSHEGTWLQLGGLPFLISLAQVNAFLLILPQTFAAVFLPLSLLGLAGWSTNWGRRVAWTTFAYVGLFAVAGYDFNQYWGALIAPMLAIGIAQAPVALVDLFRAAQGLGEPISVAVSAADRMLR